MLLEDLNPLRFHFSIDGLYFRAEGFGDKLIKFVIHDEGGMEVGGFAVTFNDEGEELDISDNEYPGTLNYLRKGGKSDAITRQIKQVVKSTF